MSNLCVDRCPLHKPFPHLGFWPAGCPVFEPLIPSKIPSPLFPWPSFGRFEWHRAVRGSAPSWSDAGPGAFLGSWPCGWQSRLEPANPASPAPGCAPIKVPLGASRELGASGPQPRAERQRTASSVRKARRPSVLSQRRGRRRIRIPYSKFTGLIHLR